MAGLKDGDVITAINGKKVNTKTQLMETIRQFRPGDKVEVEVHRRAFRHTYEVTLLNEAGNVDVVKKGDAFYNNEFGLVLKPVSRDDMANYNIKGGLKIVEVRQGRFMNSGIGENSVITKVNGFLVSDQTDLENALKRSRNRRTSLEIVFPNGMTGNFFYN